MLVKIYAFLIGIYTIFPRYLSIFSINVINILAISIFCLGFVINPKIRIYKSINLIKNTSFWKLMPLWFYMIYITTAYVLDNNTKEAIMYFFNTILFCTSLIRFIDTKERFDLILNAILKMAVFIGIYGIFECLLQGNFLFNFRTDEYVEIRNGIFRISTTFDHPIVYANYIGLVLCIICYKLWNSNSDVEKIKYIAIYLLMIINLFCTFSRSAIIGILGFQIIMIYCFKFPQKSYMNLIRFCIIPILGIFAIIILLSSESFRQNGVVQVFLQLSEGGISSVSAVGDRLSLYEWVWDDTKDNRIWGNGISSVFEYQRSSVYLKNSIEVEILYKFYHFGYVGVCVFILGIISVIKLIFNKTRDEKRDKISFNFFVRIAFLAYYIILFAVTQQSELRVYYTIICLSIAYIKLNKEEKDI